MLAARLNPPAKSTLRCPSPRRRLAGDGVSRAVMNARLGNGLARFRNRLRVKAVIRNGDKAVESTAASVKEGKDVKGSLLGSSDGRIQVRAVLTIRRKMKEGLIDKVEDQLFSVVNSNGQGIFLQLVSEQIDPDTNSGKIAEACVRGWSPPISSEDSHIVECAAEFNIPSDFGSPGAILITNSHSKEFYLVEVVLHGFEEAPIFFTANTWIHSMGDNPESRIIFRNHAYLPSQTPPGIKELRREDLLSLRGNGRGERKLHERIYDYAPYNDLGDPDKSHDLARPVFGGPEHPYPRRCRTGRPPMESDPQCESRVEKPHPVYVPRDEAFEDVKMATVSGGSQKAVFHNLLPIIAATLAHLDISFDCFSDIDKLYKDGFLLKDEQQSEKAENSFLDKAFKQVFGIGDRLLKFDVPAVIKRDRFSWMRDTEFGRQALAGVNPVNIELLKEFPIMSKLDPSVYGPPESAITKELLEQELNGMSVVEAIESKRLFMIDYHDLLMPFVNKINNIQGRKAYASRTVLFYSKSGTLKPIAIELSLPPTRSSPAFKHLYTKGDDATSDWIWKLAKAHACAIDASVHQLVNHWLRTHACTEPYIIAAHRQLSQMHPIYKLLHPHMRYTLEVNAYARQNFISAQGIMETSYALGKYAMEFSSVAYKDFWRFDMEGLPADLLRRGMAEEDPFAPGGVKLVIEDYPYAADGLLIWSAIKEWVESYVAHFYNDSSSISSDVELQEWWNEIKNSGHPDKKNEPWWPQLNTNEDLVDILTTMIWIASGQHAVINFGQYPFGGYVPLRPTLMRKLIPQEGEPEYEKFLMNPQATFLSSLPSLLETAKVMAVQDAASTHSPDEEYLGQDSHLDTHWIGDQEVKTMFKRFSSRLKEVEEVINKRNKDLHLKNRTGAGVPPFELLIPTSGPGVTGRGVPNSVST